MKKQSIFIGILMAFQIMSAHAFYTGIHFQNGMSYFHGTEKEYDSTGKYYTDINLEYLVKKASNDEIHFFAYAKKQTGEEWELFCNDQRDLHSPAKWIGTCSIGSGKREVVCLDDNNCRDYTKSNWQGSTSWKKLKKNVWMKSSTSFVNGSAYRYFQANLRQTNPEDFKDRVDFLLTKMSTYEN